MPPRVSPTKVHAEMRRDMVMTLKLAGYSNAVVRDMIAEKHGRVSVETVRNDVNKRMKDLAKHNKDSEKLRNMHVARLTKLLQSHFLRAQTDSKALNNCLKIMRELVRFQGITPPKRIEHTHLTPVPVAERNYDLSNVSTDTLAQVADIITKLEEAGVEVLEDVGIPAPPAKA